MQEFITQDYQASVQSVLDRALEGVETANVSSCCSLGCSMGCLHDSCGFVFGTASFDVLEVVSIDIFSAPNLSPAACLV